MVGLLRISRGAALAGCALIVAVVFWAPDPDDSLRSALALHDFGHVVAFGLVTPLLAVAMSTRSCNGFRRRARTAALAAGAAIALGAAIELAQAATGGNGDPWDILRDAGGAFAAALIWVARDSTLSGRARAAFAVAAISASALFVSPLLAALTDEARARSQFPVLASFESERELSRFDFRTDDPRLTATLNSDGRPVCAVRLRLPSGKYPGFVLSHFPGDWRRMRALRLLLVNPERTPFEMTVRIDDAEYDYKLDLADRYNRSFLLEPGPNRIEIPLTDVAAAPRGRRFDLGRVRSLLVFAVDLAQPRDVIIGPIVLVQ